MLLMAMAFATGSAKFSDNHDERLVRGARGR
jgi:hypothetical protein